MSQYTKSTNFATKDNLTPGDPLKIVRGTEIDTEFNNIATAIATKTDNASAAVTGGTINDTTIGATTASTGAFTTLAASGNVTLSGGTANGVPYLNGSKVVTSGSALTFDGTTLDSSITSGVAFRGTASTGTNNVRQQFVNTGGTFSVGLDSSTGGIFGAAYAGFMWHSGNYPLVFGQNNTEGMRLTSTGLGIGTSSPNAKLDVSGNAVLSGVSGYKYLYFNGSTESSSLRFAKIGKNYDSTFELGIWASTHTAGNSASTVFYRDLTTESMRIDSSGNLGLGVTPSANDYTGAAQFKWVGHSITPRSVDNFAMSMNAYHSGGGWKYGNTASASLYVQAGGQHLWSTAPSGTAGNAITFTQAMSLDASGNLMVGTTTPTANCKLTVTGAGISIAGGRGSTFALAYPDWSIYNTSSGNALAFDNGTERARIDSSGNLLVGTTTQPSGVSSSRLGVSCSVADYAVGINNTNATPYGLYIKYTAAAPNSTGSPFFYFTDSTAARSYMQSNGGLANYSGNNTNLSDRREKTNFAPAGDYLAKICAIPVQTYNYIDQNLEEDPGLTLGVVAQDVQAVAPELVTESNWGTEEEPKMRLSIYQTDLQYALMKALQELKAEFDAYKASHP